MNNNFVKNTKIVLLTATSVTGTIYLLNKIIASNITKKNTESKNCSVKNKIFEWKLGNISYNVSGKGSPLLLIHDLNIYSSSFEWDNLIKELSKDHTVYTIDLLGCGHSYKPALTYTAYMYTQLINDFTINVIKMRPDVIATGKSAPLCIMSSAFQPLMFNKIIMINPEDLLKAKKMPLKNNKIIKYILNSPIYGTFIHNFNNSKSKIDYYLKKEVIFDNTKLNKKLLNHCYENAHLCNSGSRFLNSSIKLHYTAVNPEHTIISGNNDFYIIYGNKEKNISSIVDRYTDLNDSINCYKIYNSGHLPQIEKPDEVLKILKNIL